jgi:hypothetical protein
LSDWKINDRVLFTRTNVPIIIINVVNNIEIQVMILECSKRTRSKITGKTPPPVSLVRRGIYPAQACVSLPFYLAGVYTGFRDVLRMADP